METTTITVKGLQEVYDAVTAYGGEMPLIKWIRSDIGGTPDELAHYVCDIPLANGNILRIFAEGAADAQVIAERLVQH